MLTTKGGAGFGQGKPKDRARVKTQWETKRQDN